MTINITKKELELIIIGLKVSVQKCDGLIKCYRGMETEYLKKIKQCKTDSSTLALKLRKQNA